MLDPDQYRETPMGHAKESAQLGSGSLDTCRLLGSDRIGLRFSVTLWLLAA
jgi:hypothetical protein